MSNKPLLRLAALAFCAGLAALPVAAAPERDASTPVAESYKLPISPARDQGSSDLCWAFATLSMLETNYLARHPGASIVLSRGALQRESIADRFQRMLEGQPPHLEDGGLAVDAIALIREGGLVAESDFHNYVDSDPLFASLSRRLSREKPAARPLTATRALDAALGTLPRLTHLDGHALTPRDEAKAVLGDESWSEYDVIRDGAAPHVGPSDDPDARPDTRVHYVPMATATGLIHDSLARGQSIVWGSTDNHALLIFGGDYDAHGRPLAYWVKDTFAPYVYKAPAEKIQAILTDVTVTTAPATELTVEGK